MKLHLFFVLSMLGIVAIVIAAPVSASSLTGTVKITSSPSGATVFLDNVNKGATPATLNNIIYGTHTVTMKKTGYNDYKTTIMVFSGRTTTISANLVPVPALTGSIAVTSSPTGATVLLDNVNKGMTPVTLSNVVPGNHAIALQKTGYNNYNTNVMVQSGKTATISVTLTPVPPISWIYQVPAGSTNAALLSSAKALMRGVYTYSSGSPDYLPASYTNEKTSQTAYLVHSANPTSVVWAPVGGKQVIWQSNPGTTPKGWSGIVVAAGPVNTNGNPQVLNVKTDCSGFITSLFTNANTLTTTKFTNWTKGSLIPEAGCSDPQGSCVSPNPLNYYQLFVSGQKGWFQSVSLSNLQPGDIISWANTNTKDKSSSGHIMLVAAVSNGTDNSKSRQVVVIDETGPNAHSSDTRTSGAGIGMGYARLVTSPAGTLQFYWNLTTPSPQIGPIALGRAL